MNIRTRSLLCAVTAAATVGTVAGCGSRIDPATSMAPPELGPVPVVRSYAEITFPLDAYHSTPEQRGTLVHALSVATSECMRRFGFQYPVLDAPAVPLRDRSIGVVSAEEVAVHGYRNRQAEKYARERDALREKEIPTSTAMASVPSGSGPSTVSGVAVPAGGCVGEARRALGADATGTTPGSDDFLLGLEARSSDLAEADNRLKAAFGAWQECMLAAGYHYATPWGPNDDPAFATEEVTPEEIATARTDVACRNDNDVNGIWVAVRSAYQDQLIARHARDLREHQRVQDVRFDRSAAVVERGGVG